MNATSNLVDILEAHHERHADAAASATGSVGAFDCPETLCAALAVIAAALPTQREPTLTASLARKINTGNYESAEVFVSISGVRAGMSADDLAPLLSTGRIAYDEMRAALAEQINETIAALGL